jgi:hypothetical protein
MFFSRSVMVGMVAIIEFLLLSKFPFARGYFIIGL